jgi:adenylylsulfate kinase
MKLFNDQILMLLIQMTGLSGAGKSSIAYITRDNLTSLGYKVELLDGDECRRQFCHDLGFSKADRLENIQRLGFVGNPLALCKKI